MSGGDTEVILKAFDENRREFKSDMSELRKATAEVATAVAQLTTTVARVEERHASHDDGMRRIGMVIDDHEARIRIIEKCTNARWSRVSGGWAVLTIVGSLIVGIAAVWGNVL